MPAVAIEAVIIIILLVSFTVLAAIVCALYWLWRLLLEDRRCTRLDGRSFSRDWQRQSLGPLVEEGPNRALLTRGRAPSRREVLVDERSRRMVKAARCGQCPEPPTVVTVVNVPPPMATVPRNPDVVVLDGTEPPPPYEESTR